MASGQHGPGFRDLFKPALQHRRKDVQGDLLRRKRRDVHGRPRHAADRVHVRKRVRRRNLPEQAGIVAERAQDVHRLYQRHARRRRAENHRVLVVLESVQHASLRVGGTRQGRQNLLQQLWSRLRRSAGGLGFVHQSERHDMLLYEWVKHIGGKRDASEKRPFRLPPAPFLFQKSLTVPASGPQRSRRARAGDRRSRTRRVPENLRKRQIATGLPCRGRGTRWPRRDGGCRETPHPRGPRWSG